MQEQEIPTINEDVEQTIPVEYDNEPIQGINATIQIGTTTTGEAGTDASVENVGTETHAILDFTIPRGDKGDRGDKGNKGDTGDSATIEMHATATTLSAGSQATATVTNSGDSHNANYTLALGIPQGVKGDRGERGVQGERGERGEQGIQGIQGIQGETGEAFSIYKTYPSVADMNADASNVPEGKFTLIASNVDDPDNSKLFVKNGEGTFTYLTDMSGAQGIQGERGEQGIQGIQGIQGVQGETGARGSVKSQYVAELPATGDEDTFYLVDRDLESHTESGEYITLETTQTAAAIQSAQIDGNTTQGGTPTPDSPIPVQTTTGENVVKIEGKNLFDGNYIAYAIGGSNGNQWFAANSTRSAIIPCQPSTTYTIKKDGGNRFSIAEAPTIPENNSVVNVVFNNSAVLEHTLTTGATTRYLLVYVSNANEEPQMQAELGSQASDYQPYQGQEFPIDLGSIELAKIGNYQDRIYKEDSKWYIEKQVGKVVIDGTESGWGWADTARYTITTANIGAREAISDNFTYVNYTGHATTASPSFDISSNLASIGFHDKDITSLNNFKTWLSTHSTTVYYALATPTTTEITNEALIDQLEALASATLNQGVNNIWTEIATGNAMPTLELNWVEWEKYNRHNVYIWNGAINDWQIIVGMDGES